jgi:hypothetical protein
MGATMSISPTAELEVSGRIMSRDLVVTGTGGMSIGGGTTAQRAEYPALGTIRYNSTTGFMEGYAAAGWAPIAQPPTITGLSPLTTLTSGGIAVGWNTGTKIQASDKQSADYFGYSVSTSSDGTKVIVGAIYEDADSVGDAGAAYIYTYSGGSWDAGTKIVASDKASSDYFGKDVSISGDGTKVIVGAEKEDAGSTTDAGSAYIFTYDGSSWDTGTKIQASDKQASDRFGNSVSMSSDGTKVIVGAESEDPGGTSDGGAAYIFALSSGSWSQEAKIVASDKQVNDYFGNSVSMNSDGTKVIVGAQYEDTGGSEAGAAYIFTYSGSSWDTGTKIQASDKQASDYFGNSVAMSSDGTKVIVGARMEDPGGTTDAGSAYIFTYSSGSWGTGVKIQASDKQGSDMFGSSVSMNSDGTKVLVGAAYEDTGGNNAGAAYIFTYSSGSWDTGTKILASDAEAQDYFGSEYSRSVSISGDGTKVIVGAYGEDTGGSAAGAAYIYDYRATELFDTSTQVFTATGTGIVSGSTVQLEGADGSLYSVSNVTPNAAGTQVTFKMGSEAVEFPPSAMSTNTSITGYTASGSMPGAAQAYAWRAFDDVVNTAQYWFADGGNATAGYSTSSPYLAGLNSAATQDISGTTHRGHWIQLQIPSPVILTRAVIGSTTSTYQHGQFVILGSNDGTNWTLLHAGTGTTLSTNVTTLSAGVTTSFTYFRVVIKSKFNGSGHNLEINNVQFFGGSGSWVLANQPYKLKVSSTSGLIGTSTAAIGLPVGWTSPAAGADLYFDTAVTTTQTLVGTDGGGGTNRTFSVAPGSNALPAGLALTGSTGAITGQIAANQDGVTTSVTFRLTDTATGLFADRAINIAGTSILYTMAFPFTFTNAGATGRIGPTLTQLRNAYAPTWTGYTSNLNVSSTAYGPSGVQEWTVPATGTYSIAAYGARGGTQGSQTLSNNRHGKGAKMQGTFTLTRGEILKIAVGQAPNDIGTATSHAGHGGGGTGVIRSPYNTNASILVIAGGGGGAGYAYANSTGAGHGLTTNEGGYNFSTHADSSGNGGKHTHSPGDCGWGGGGGGFFTHGWAYPHGDQNNQSNYSQLITNPGAGLSFINSIDPGGGGAGGGCSGAYGGEHGGFGCGGGGSGSHGGSGGGGYSGGSGSHYTGSGAGGVYGVSGAGGGSYNSGSSQSNASGVNNGSGYVIITKL